MRKCFELIAGQHRKFWTVETVGPHYICTFGRIGSAGQSQIKTLVSARKAMDKANDMIREKEAKGYRQVGNNAHPGARKVLLDSLGGTPTVTATEPQQEQTAPTTTGYEGRRIIMEKPEGN